MKFTLYKISLILFLCTLTACSVRTKLQTRFVAEADKNVCSLAVMPFENWTRNPAVAQMATHIFTSELISQKSYAVIQPGEVGLFRLRRRILPGALLLADDYVALTNQLGVDAVVQGRVVEEGSEASHRGDPTPYLAFNVDLYDARTGRLLANSVHHRNGAEYRKIMHFGVVTTASGLAQKMAQEIINDWLSKGVLCQ